MLYRFKDFLSRSDTGQHPSEAKLYRGVIRSLAEKDLDLNRLHFSRAIIHDEDTQNSELFRTDQERSNELDLLGIGGEGLSPEKQRSKKFFESADKHCSGMAYVSCWSYNRAAALDFPYSWPTHDRALLSVSESELARCFLDCLARWNSQQPGEYEMTWSDHCFCNDWDPRSVRFAYGKIDYPDPSDCSSSSPFRLGRAMRLPGGPQDGDLQEEDEWRISLDLSELPSSIYTDRMVKTELLPKTCGNAISSTGSCDLEPMISFNGTCGLWLNKICLSGADSFKFEVL